MKQQQSSHDKTSSAAKKHPIDSASDVLTPSEQKEQWRNGIMEPSSLTPVQMLQLQRTVGNRAVLQLVSAHLKPKDPASAGAAKDQVIQRTPVYHKPKSGSGSSKDEKEGIEKALKVDNIVNQAYVKFMTGNYTGASDAQIQLYVLRKFQFDNGDKTMHPSTAAGYVIEGMVNSVIKGWEGVDTQVTGELPGTRPDVAITLESGKAALVDITASKSAGHILNKKGNWLGHVNIPVVLESVYPSIDFNNMKPIELSKEEMKQLQARIQSDKEAIALAEAELQTKRSEEYTERQNMLIDKLTELQNVIGSGQDVYYRTTERSEQAFLKCGLIVKIDSSKGEWKINRIPYDQWLQLGDRSQIADAMESLLKIINLRIEQTN